MSEIPSIATMIKTVTEKIVISFPDQDLKQLYLIGIGSNGSQIAQRIQKEIRRTSQHTCSVGFLDITLFQDKPIKKDATPLNLNYTHLPKPIANQIIILVTDEIASGRSIQAALSALQEYGNTQKIHTAALIDRNIREMPILCNFFAHKSELKKSKIINVKLLEIHGEDSLVIQSKK